MGFYKLREWVGTVTGKGDRWEGDGQVGRSEPAFRVASTTALPPLTWTARREAGRLLAVCFLRPVPDGESAGCVACSACSAGCVPAAIFACHFAPVMPTALINILPPFILFCPVQFIFALPPVHSMCARIAKTTVCKLLDCPVGSCNTGLQWRPVRRFHFDSLPFSCRVHDPGPWE